MSDTQGNNDKDYAKILKMMRVQGAKNNPPCLELGTMMAKRKCSVGDLVLDKDDLMVNSSVKSSLSKGDTVACLSIPSAGVYVILCKVEDI